MKRGSSRTIVALSVLTGIQILVAGVSRAENWPAWRGPTGVGRSAEEHLPLTWDGKSGQNVLWKVSLAGTTGHSCPIVWGDRVFLTTAAKQTPEQEESKQVPEHHLACYQAGDGKLLWRTPIAPGKNPAGYAIYAVPTPATDGKVVYAWFGSAVLAAVGSDGKLLWRKERPGPFTLNPGICSSPILYKDTVILLCDQGRGKGFLQGLDKKTGEVTWQQKREKVSYNNTTPVLIKVSGKPQVVIAASNAVQGLGPADGEIIWWCKARGFGESPAFGGGLIYADKGGNETAVCVDPTGSGDVTDTHVKWRIDKSPGEYSSPVIAGKYVYKARGEEDIVCLDLATGKEFYTAELDGVSNLASPFATADGRVYFATAGKSYVIAAGPKPALLATNDLRGEMAGSSPAVSGGRIFIRGRKFLYCIGSK